MCELKLAQPSGAGQALIRCMQIRLIVAGKPALAYAKAGVDEYLKRLSRCGRA